MAALDEARDEFATAMPLTRHLLPDLLLGAWARRADLRLVDALYVELCARLNVPLLTTDPRLSRACPLVEGIATSIPGQQPPDSQH